MTNKNEDAKPPMKSFNPDKRQSEPFPQWRIIGGDITTADIVEFVTKPGYGICYPSPDEAPVLTELEGLKAEKTRIEAQMASAEWQDLPDALCGAQMRWEIVVARI